MDQLATSGVAIALNIKKRCRAQKVTIRQVFNEAGVSYDAYRSWRGGKIEPRMRTVKKVNAVLERLENAANGGVCNTIG